MEKNKYGINSFGSVYVRATDGTRPATVKDLEILVDIGNKAPETLKQRDDLLETNKKSVSAILDMTSELNHMHAGTTIDYDWSERLKTIEGASRMVLRDLKQAIAEVEDN